MQGPKTEVGADAMTLKYFACLSFVCIAVNAGHAGATRVALVSTDDKEVIRNVLDLAEADLGARPRIETLDRRQVERVLAEQKMSLSGLVAADQVVAAGKLLPVDLFAVVETAAGGKEVLGLIVLQAQTGVRLWDAPLPAGDAKQVAGAVASGVAQAVEKSRSDLRQLKPLCLLGVRNADLPRELDSFCESVGLMLERRLLASPSVVVLERKRLDQLNRERSLPGAGSARELLTSLFLLELEVSRVRKGSGLRARAVFTDGKGEKLAEVTARADGMDAASLVEPLLKETLRVLRAAPARGAGDRLRESSRFLREGQLLWSHRLWRNGLQAMECASALDPANRNTRALLAEYLLYYAVSLVDPRGVDVLSWGGLHKITVDPSTLTTALKLAQRGVEMQHTDLLQMGSRERPTLTGYRFRHMGSRRSLRLFLNKLLHVEVRSPESREALASFRDAVERALLEECGAWAEGVTKHPGQGDVALPKGPAPDSFFSQYCHTVRESTELLKWNAPDASAFEKALAQAAQQWLRAARRQVSESFQVWHLTWFLEDLIANATNPFGASWTLQASDVAPWAEVFEAMQQQRHPVIALYGQCGSALVGLKRKQLTPGDCRERYEKMKRQAREWIEDPPLQRGQDQLRAGCYKALAFALNVLSFGPDVGSRTAEYFALCDFMLGRKELVDEVLNRALTSSGPAPGQEAKRLELVNRALALVEQPQCRFLSGHKQHVKDVLLPVREKLLAGTAPRREVPWEGARKVFDLSQLKGAQALLGTTLAGGHVYAAGCGLRGEQGFLQLVRINLSDGAVRVLGKTDVTLKRYGPGRASVGLFVNPPFVRRIVEGEGTVYVGTLNDGIYAFGPSGAVRRLDEKQGFPSTQVEGLAFIGGKLYAALGGGYIVVYDPKAERAEVLASSRRKEKLTPFDDLEGGFFVTALAADPERDRLLLAVYERQVRALNRPGAAREPVSGLWELNVKTGTFKRRLRFSSFSHASYVSPVRGNHLLLSSNTWALDYDLARDRADLLWAFNPVGPDLGVDKARCQDYFGMSAPRWYHDGWLWTDRPFGRLSITSKRQERFPALGKPHDANPFQPREGIEPLKGEDQLLVADLYTVWVVSLRKEKGK